MMFGRVGRAAAIGLTIASLTIATASAGSSASNATIDGPPTVTGAGVRFAHPSQTLRYGRAEQVGLLPRYIDKIATDIAGFLQPSPVHPQYAGAVALAARDGVIVAHDAVGYALRYSDDKPTELPPD